MAVPNFREQLDLQRIEFGVGGNQDLLAEYAFEVQLEGLPRGHLVEGSKPREAGAGDAYRPVGFTGLTLEFVRSPLHPDDDLDAKDGDLFTRSSPRTRDGVWARQG